MSHPRFDCQALLAATRDTVALVAEWNGDLGPAARRAGVDPDEVRRSAAVAADLHFAPLLSSWRARVGDPRELAIERIWATVFLIGRRLRVDAGLPPARGPLELDVHVRYAFELPPPRLLDHRVGLLLPHALGPPASYLLSRRAATGRAVRQALYRLSEHALATAFVGL